MLEKRIKPKNARETMHRHKGASVVWKCPNERLIGANNPRKDRYSF